MISELLRWLAELLIVIAAIETHRIAINAHRHPDRTRQYLYAAGVALLGVACAYLITSRPWEH